MNLQEHDSDRAAMPLNLSEDFSDYFAVRERVGICDLSHDGKYLLTGEDRTNFLQNVTSNDVRLAHGNKGIETLLLTAKGKIISDFYLYPLADAYLLTMDVVIAEKTARHFMQVRLRSKINIVAPQWGKILVAGPNAFPLLQKLYKDNLPNMEALSIFSQEQEPILCVRQPQTGEEDYHLYCRKESLQDIFTALLTLGEPFGVAKVGQSTLETLRIEAGIPRYGVDLSEEIIPIEAGLADPAISYTKGCYPGQEVVARIRTYGHVNKHRMGLLFDENVVLSGGEKVFLGDTEVGWITAGRFSPFLNKMIATAYLRTVAAISGTRVALANQKVFATVADLPFYRRG